MQREKRKWTISPERAAQYEAERRQIIRVAYRLMGNGSGPVSIQDILDATGLGTRAFYRHFASKNDLFLGMYRDDNQRVSEALSAATTSEPDPWLALQAWVDISLSVAYQPTRLRHARVLRSAEVQQADGYAQELLDGKVRNRASLEALVERGVAEQAFRTDHPADDAFVVAGATNEYVGLRLDAGEDAPSQAEALESVMRAARRLLGPDRPVTGTRGRRGRAASLLGGA